MAKLNVTQDEYNVIRIIMAQAGATRASERMNESKYFAGMIDLLGEEVAHRMYAFLDVEIVVYPSVAELPRHREKPDYVRRFEYGNSI